MKKLPVGIELFSDIINYIKIIIFYFTGNKH